MNTYTLVKEGELYAVYENEIRAKNAIFSGIEDFRQELEWLGLSGCIVIRGTK